MQSPTKCLLRGKKHVMERKFVRFLTPVTHIFCLGAPKMSGSLRENPEGRPAMAIPEETELPDLPVMKERAPLTGATEKAAQLDTPATTRKTLEDVDDIFSLVSPKSDWPPRPIRGDMCHDDVGGF